MSRLLRFKLTFVISFILLTGMIIGIIYLTDSTLRKAVLDQYENRQKLLVQQIAGRIETTIGQLVTKIYNLSIDVEIQNFSDENRMKSLKEITKVGEELFLYLRTITIYDNKGKIMMAWPTTSLDATYTQISQGPLGPMKSRSFHLVKKRKMIYTTVPPFTNTEMPMMLTMPIFSFLDMDFSSEDADDFVGAILFEVEWEVLKTELLTEIDAEQSADLLLMTKEGFVLYYSKAGDDMVKTLQLLAPITERMREGEPGEGFFVDENEVNNLLFYNPIVIGSDLWSLALIEPEAAVFVSLNKQLNQIYTVLGITILLIGGLIFFISRQYGRLDNLNIDLNRRVEDLNEIHSTAKVISSTFDLEMILRTGLESISRLVSATKGSIFLLEENREEMTSRARYGYEEGAISTSKFKVGQGVAGLVAKEGKAIIVEDVNKDQRFLKTATKWEGCRSLMTVPLHDDEEIKGIINLQDRADGSVFTPHEAQLAETVANNIAIAVKNIELLESVKDKVRLEKELETAKAVQENLFPTDNPHYEDFDITGFFDPAGECGGDWWGYILSRGKLLLFIGDVTGHGVPAALITATVRTYCTNLELLKEVLPEQLFSPRNILKNLNSMLVQSTSNSHVMTFFVSEYDPQSRKLTFANAGHNLPWVYRKGKSKVEILKARGLRLGDVSSAEFHERSVVLNEGDVILWYTDGLTEGENPDGRQYGKKRTKQILTETAHLSSAEIQKAIIEDAYNFFADEPKKDDITLVVGKIEKNGILEVS